MTDRRTHLSFSVGPVQAFVAQARRTRDLWAGSWLLSYLTECALAAAERAGGSAIIPHRDPEASGTVTSVKRLVGNIPNRVELAFDDTEAARRGVEAAEAAFHEAWTDLARAVWQAYLDQLVAQGLGNGTAAIWSRQVDSFWELSWVIGSPPEGERTMGRLAGARKGLRDVSASPEPGTKCSLMANLQELSGAGGDDQRAFWLTLVDAYRAGRSDFVVERGRDGTERVTERLCAIALIKRLFPRTLPEALGARREYAYVDALSAQKAWPSTPFLAARPWLDYVQRTTHADQAHAFARAAQKAGVGTSETQAADDAGLPDWCRLDANAWFGESLAQNEWGVEIEALEQLTRDHGDLCAAEKVGGQPQPHFALVLMDGDDMGRLLANLESPGELSACLDAFASNVDGIIREHRGRTVYAGGDDVLAMLPAPDALEAADELARAYESAFAGEGVTAATLSGAIVFSHWKSPLRKTLETAHRLLDEYAKKASGRDSLAIGLMQAGALNALWSVPWPVVQGEVAGTMSLRALLPRFGEPGVPTDEPGEASADPGQQSAWDSRLPRAPTFNASFLYHLRDRFARLFADFPDQPGYYARLPREIEAPGGSSGHGLGMLGQLAHAEYRRRMPTHERQRQPPPDTEAHIGPLMALSQHWDRDIGRSPPVKADAASFGFDGWRVARFLQQVRYFEDSGDDRA